MLTPAYQKFIFFVLSENWVTIDPTFFFLISEFHARLSYITKYNTTHIVFIHRKTRNKKKEQIYRETCDENE
jgi:hypothetical protein